MAVFIDLWPCLLTTKLSYAQLFKWGHSSHNVSLVFFVQSCAVLEHIFFILITGILISCMPPVHFCRWSLWYGLFLADRCKLLQRGVNKSEFNWFPQISLKKTIQLQWNGSILETFRNKTFLFVKSYGWKSVRFHKI